MSVETNSERSRLSTKVMAAAENGRIPDWIVRLGIRGLLRRRLAERRRAGPEATGLRSLVDELKRSPIAYVPDVANEQHYEVPTGFFEKVLGGRMKYSSAYWPAGVERLDEAEEAMLQMTCERAELEDGQNILELGCGWGSLTLWMSEKYPDSRIVAVSNSRTQREFIERTAEFRGLDNVEVRTADMNDFETDETFDRVVSIEMFEHMRNYEKLMGRIAGWLEPGGKLFVHVFCHRDYPYPFEDRGPGDWMARYFFTGGLMPSLDLLPEFQRDLELEADWQVDGRNYGRTAEAWLRNMDRNEAAVLRDLEDAYGKDADRWKNRWRLFFMAVEELFDFRGGKEWLVAHYRFRRPMEGAT